MYRPRRSAGATPAKVAPNMTETPIWPTVHTRIDPARPAPLCTTAPSPPLMPTSSMDTASTGAVSRPSSSRTAIGWTTTITIPFRASTAP